jgi:GcrA cell cycle regulator
MSADGAIPARRRHDHDAILDRWQAGESSYAISRGFSVMPETIRAIVVRARMRGDPRAIEHLSTDSREWPPERVETLKQLWAEGLSASAIAKQIGGTRNAIIGKVHRLNLPRRKPAAPRPPRVKREKPPRTNRDARRDRRLAGVWRWAHPADKIKTVTIPAARTDIPLPVSLGIPLLALRDEQCRYPDGGPRDPAVTFCGHPVFEVRSGDRLIARRPYCEAHCALAYVPAESHSKGRDERTAAYFGSL